MGVLKIQFSQVETETLRFSLWQHKPKPTQNTSFALLKPKARVWEKRPGVEIVISAFGTCVCVYCSVYRGGSFTLTLQDCVCIALSTGVVVSHWHYKTVHSYISKPVTSGVTPIGQGWTNARGLRGLGAPVHVVTCCILPYIHFVYLQ